MLRNRKVIISILIASILGLIIFLITKTATKLKHKDRIAKQIKTFPYLAVKSVSPNNYDGWKKLDKTTIIIFFNSSCEHCQYEANEIQQRIKDFAGTNLLFISEESEEKIFAFSKEYQMNNTKNIWWLMMKPEDVYETFGAIGVPHIWIYNKDEQLVKEFKGETKAEAILEWL